MLLCIPIHEDDKLARRTSKCQIPKELIPNKVIAVNVRQTFGWRRVFKLNIRLAKETAFSHRRNETTLQIM